MPATLTQLIRDAERQLARRPAEWERTPFAEIDETHWNGTPVRYYLGWNGKCLVVRTTGGKGEGRQEGIEPLRKVCPSIRMAAHGRIYSVVCLGHFMDTKREPLDWKLADEIKAHKKLLRKLELLQFKLAARNATYTGRDAA